MSIYKHLFSSNSVANTISKMQVLLAYRSEYCIAFIFRNIFRIQEVPIYSEPIAWILNVLIIILIMITFYIILTVLFSFYRFPLLVVCRDGSKIFREKKTGGRESWLRLSNILRQLRTTTSLRPPCSAPTIGELPGKCHHKALPWRRRGAFTAGFAASG